jgi:hypothetical protein
MSKMKKRIVQIMLALLMSLASSAAFASERAGVFVLPNFLPSGTGDPNYSYSSAGSTPTFANIAPGEYIVMFPGLANVTNRPGEGGNVQVTSHQAFIHCNPRQWAWAGTAVQVVVDCFNRFGVRTNAKFAVAYRQMFESVGSPGIARAYLRTPNSSGPILVDPIFTFSTGGVLSENTVVQTGTGNYRVSMTRLPTGTKGGTVMVSALGTENGAMRWCKVGGWSFNPAGSVVTIDVSCFALGGSADSKFTVFFGVNTVNKLGSSAYVWSELTNPPANFVPNTFYQAVMVNRSSQVDVYSPSAFPSGDITLSRLGLGQYQVTVPRLSAVGVTNALVSAYGIDNSNHCWVSQWVPSGTTQNITVGCADAGDVMRDTRFVLQFGTSQSSWF